jgi:hypothetical protein
MSLIFYYYWLLLFTHLSVPLGVYTPFTLSLRLGDRFLFLILVIVLVLYVHLCIQPPPAEIGFICLIHVPPPLYLAVPSSFVSLSPIVFSRISVVVLGLP